MKHCILSIVLACWFLLPSSASAVDTKFSALEAVNYNGSNAYVGSGAITLSGVVINNPNDMLNGATEWQVFIQPLDASDYGGAALYMTKTLPWNGTVLYDSQAWTNELNRITSNGALKYGDIVQVQANAPGMFYKGKFNINEKHSNNSLNDFDITIQGSTTPLAAKIDLSYLKDEQGQFKFDASRATGCEHYQGSLVQLDNLTIVDASQWTLGNTHNPLTVRQTAADGITRTFDLILGLDSALARSPAEAELLETTPFSVTAILDQEDPGTTITNPDAPDFGVTYYNGGYRLWLTSNSMLTVPEPGSWAMLAAGLASSLIFVWQKRKNGGS